MNLIPTYIVAKSGEGVLHGFYLGRDIFEAKKNIGKKQPPTINPKTQQP